MADNRKTVLIVKTMPEAGRRLLEAREDVRVLPFALDTKRADLLAMIAAEPRLDAMILGVQKIGPDEIAAAKGLQAVARIGVGYDAIDVPALTAARIPLLITGEANSPSVAEKALHFMLALAKRGTHMDALVRGNRWTDRLSQMPADLLGKTVLIIGFGRIGTRTAKRCHAMEMKVLVTDPHIDPAAISAAGCEPVTLEAGLPRADFVTIHCPKTSETTNLIAASALARMKPTAFLVNTARGGIVDEVALATALAEGRLAGAGLDVLLEEPPPADHPLFKAPNVLLAPHMAGVTREAFDRMAVQAAENVLSALDGRTIRANVVNTDVL